MDRERWLIIAAGFEALGTVGATLVALFGKEIMFWRRPNLKASIRLSAPDMVKTKMGRLEADCYFLRILVQNKKGRCKGKVQAKDVEVFAAELQQRTDDGDFAQVERFLPMNLMWAHTLGKPRASTRTDISPGMKKHCDLGYILKPEDRRALVASGKDYQTLPDVPDDQTVLCLKIEKPPMTRGHLIGPGVYRLKVEVGAANQKPITKTLQIRLSGEWYDEPKRMQDEGIQIDQV